MRTGRSTAYTTDVSPGDYVRALRRGLWIILLTTALATLGAVYASMRQEKLYRSSADVLLSSQDLAAILADVQPKTSEDPVRVAATQAALATTPQVAALALRLAHVNGLDPNELLGESSVSSAPDADILTFSVADPSPRLAEQLAQAYATAYTTYRRRLDTTTIAQALNDVNRRLAQLRTAGEGRSSVYTNLLDKQEQLSTLQVLQGSNAQVVRSADAAVLTQPRTLRNTALAAIVGLVLGVALAIVREALDTRVRTGGEIEARLDLPLLARVPDPRRRLRAKTRVPMLTRPRSGTAEAYRILAADLEFVNLERGARSIMFTSARRGEGKSTTVANLAVAIARSGRRVIIADLDFRAPSLATLFHMKNESGLTQAVHGRLGLDAALIPVPLGNRQSNERHGRNGAIPGSLEVLPVGPLPLNPAELAASQALDELLRELERRADLVLVDAPPLLGLSDAVTLSSRVDALVVVTRLPAVRRPALQELRRVLDAAPVTKLGFVLTGTDGAA